MKRLLLVAIAAAFFIACDNDDERVIIDDDCPVAGEDTVQFTSFQIDYRFSASEDFMEFYHFLIGYTDVMGQQHVDTLAGDGWHYETGSFPLEEAPDKFECVVLAKRKQADVPELTKYAYTLGYERHVTVTLANSDGSRIRTFDGAPMTSWSWQAAPAALRETLVKTINATLVDFVLEKSAFSDSE